MRAKTEHTAKVKKEIAAIVSPEMKAIIDRWGNPDKKPGNHIFPFLTGKEDPTQETVVIADIVKRTNKKLKVIGEAIGVEHLSTYSARHSFATVLKRSGSNIAFISESLGHADIKTTENYLDSFEKSERLKAAANLTKFE
jgi:integrase